jgi:glucose/arabinose dehydrogenase
MGAAGGKRLARGDEIPMGRRDVNRIAIAIAIMLLVPPLVPAPSTEAGPTTQAALPVVALQRVLSGLTEPLFVTHAGDGSGRLFVVEKAGRIRVIINGQLQPTPFLDVEPLVNSGGSEQGLLGLAFHPSYATNGRFFVSYTANTWDNTVARYQRSTDDPNRADPAGGQVLLAIPDLYTNHNGGMLAFGPDGYLHVGTGDGGSAGDPDGNGQNPDSRLGKILRLDVNGGSPAEGRVRGLPRTCPAPGLSPSPCE